MTAELITIDQIDSFNSVKNFPAQSIIKPIIEQVKNLDERRELEPFILSILADTNETPHGPAEIVDIFTHKVIYRRNTCLSAFILKGKSFSTVRPVHVSHQIYRLEKISGLDLAIFASTGTILDQAKEQFISTSKRLGIKYSIFDANDISRLLLAYGFYCPKDGNRIIAGRCRCGYAPQKRLFNILQKDAIDRLHDAHEAGEKAGLIILPTGSGKTRVAAVDTKNINSQFVLYVAHTHEILEVALSEFEAVHGKDNVRYITNKQQLNNPLKINLATIQFLSKNINFLKHDSYDYLIIDEFHHAAARSYKTLLQKIDYSFLLGLTATPFRGDRQDIVEICDGNVLVDHDLRSGIDSGVLSPYNYYGIFDDIDYSKISLNGTQYGIKDLEKVFIIPERDSAIISKWIEYADGKPTLAYCCSHKHAKRFASRLNSEGISAKVYLSSTPLSDRKKITDNFETGKVSILCTVDVLNEGADFPFVECLLFLRPTESKRIFFQQLGRGLRKSVGKLECIVIDFIGNFQNAYKIVEYHDLSPYSEEQSKIKVKDVTNIKELLNLPLGCKVNFDERVIDIFAQQTLNPKYATRHNIGRILIYQFQRLQNQLGREPTAKDIDRSCILDANFYKDVFGSWKKFVMIMSGKKV